MSKLFAVGLGLAIVIGFSFAGASAPRQDQPAKPQQEQPATETRLTFEPEPVRVLDPDTIAVRLLLGVSDQQTRPWGGKVTVDRGEVVGVDGWRFRQTGKITGRDTWEASSLLVRNQDALKKNALARKNKAVIAAGQLKKAVAKARTKKTGDAENILGAAQNTSTVTPTGVVVRLKAPEDAILALETKQGRAEIRLADLSSGQANLYQDGRVEARRVPTYAPLASGPAQEDLPAAVGDGKGGAWVAILAHDPRGPAARESLRVQPANFKSFVPEGGGDRIELIHYDSANLANGERIEVTGPGRDLWRPAVARDDQGQIVVVWPEQKDGNWDLYTRSFDPKASSWSEQKRLTTDPGADTDPVLTTFKGQVLVAWQAWRDGQADILLAPVANGSTPINVSNDPADEWSPAIAAGPAGVYVAFDSYRNGNYDVFLASLAAAEKSEPTLTAVASSSKFEARPSLAVDASGRAWVAYEVRSENWGKDFGKLPEPKGSSLYASSTVKVRVVDGARVLETADPVAAANPRERSLTSFARLTLDASGRPWLLYRKRIEWTVFGGAVLTSGPIWAEFATTLAGKSWTPPQPLPRSDNLLDNRPALIPRPDGGILVAYSGDGRLHREVDLTRDLGLRFFSSMSTPAGLINNDVFIAALAAPKGAPAGEPLGPVEAAKPAPPVHPKEAEDVARIRSHRVNAGAKAYQLLRGEFHRHTEISLDGAADGSLEDMWRYAIDAGRLDWIGCGDHDNGGTEYTWWITQKTTDLYHAPPRFVPLFTYERSVQYPGGHRNVMFPYRGVRTLPRLVDEKGVRTDVSGRDEDAEMLYAYLHELGGICASHTTATSMGTDWRANDPEVEPFVEIYQGIRDSYEHLGAPRVPRQPEGAAGGWAPLGEVWNALALQYRLGFQSSSDHVSTHISFAIALAEEPSRKGIFEAFKKRHCYAATDNIVLDVRSGDHVMGDEFTAAGPLTLKVFARGTAPIKKVDVIKNFVYVYSTAPGTEETEFRWTDEDTSLAGDLSWYYVRLIQEDGELAWGSPIWVHKENNAEVTKK